ncbi:MAG: hypothetical protein ACRD1B_00035 [Thermoanaerobaculia bacterium]
MSDDAAPPQEPTGGIRYGDIPKMQELTDAQRAELGKAISFIRKTWWFFPDWLMVAFALVAGGCFYFFPKPWVRAVTVVVVIQCAGGLVYRRGVDYGFERGYEDGHVKGVRKALGLTDEEAEKIETFVMEAERDNHVAALMKAAKEKKAP